MKGKVVEQDKKQQKRNRRERQSVKEETEE
jgi:hypothetical protein